MMTKREFLSKMLLKNKITQEQYDNGIANIAAKEAVIKDMQDGKLTTSAKKAAAFDILCNLEAAKKELK